MPLLASFRTDTTAGGDRKVGSLYIW